METRTPTPDEAAAALVEARLRATQLRKADAQLQLILAALAGAILAIAGLVGLAPHVGSPGVGTAVLAVYVSCIVVSAVVLLRARAYSRAGLLIFTATACSFTLWNALISVLSVATRWWGPNQPPSHFGVSELIAVIPLLVGAAIIWRRAA